MCLPVQVVKYSGSQGRFPGQLIPTTDNIFQTLAMVQEIQRPGWNYRLSMNEYTKEKFAIPARNFSKFLVGVGDHWNCHERAGFQSPSTTAAGAPWWQRVVRMCLLLFNAARRLLHPLVEDNIVQVPTKKEELTWMVQRWIDSVLWIRG